MLKAGSVEHALLLAGKGWSVFPVHFKTPLTPNGFLDAESTDEKVRQLWGEHGENATGVGVATGEVSGVWVLDVDVSDEKRGDDSLAELEGAQGKLPPTYSVMTGGGGLHFFFNHHLGVRNSGGRIGTGLDVRGDGGYVVGPGSLHESGGVYRRELESPDSAIDAPDWLVELVEAASAGAGAEPAAPPVEGDLRPWLADQGWTRVRILRNQQEYWRRPGKSHGEHSGVWSPPSATYPQGCFYNYSPNAPGLEADTLYGLKVDPFADQKMWLEEMDAFLHPNIDVEERDDLRWHPVSLFNVWNEPAEDPPSVGCRTDGVFLLYRGKVHTIYGEPSGMKSFFTQLIALQVVEAGGTVLFIDLENTRKSLCERFRYLQMTQEDLRNIDVINPDSIFSMPERQLVEHYCKQRGYELIVIDGTTDAMALFGLEPKDGIDAAKFDRAFLKPLARTGAAVIYVDHVTKDRESRGSWGIGSQHKRSAIDGAAFGVEVVSSFGKGRIGRARIILHKDKNGDLSQHALDGDHTCIAELELDSHPETNLITTAAIHPPSPTNNPNFRPTAIMDILSSYIEKNPGLSKEVIVTGARLSNAKQPWVTTAFQKLEVEGYIAADLGDRRDKRWRSKRHYDEIQDTLDQRGPVEPDPVADASMDRVRERTARLLPEDLLPDEPDAEGADHPPGGKFSRGEPFDANL